MSMLAERKIKQKWSLNPRGKVWSEDSTKFGQKMLEKMGWSKGKGLGPNENGIVEHLKISYKNDSKGMGYKETDDQWTEHDANFNALLQTLSGEKPQKTDLKLSSLEEKSQNSKVRVHYQKFTRGKDLSKCSEKDLANIFGKKSLIQTKNDTKIKIEIEKLDEKKNEDFTINSGSMLDYFKKKLPNFGKNNYIIGSNGVLKNESESEEEEQRPGFGTKRKCNEIEIWSPQKKKKFNKNEEKGLTNPGFDPFNPIQIQKHTLNTIKEEDENYVEEKEKNDSEDSRDFSHEQNEILKKKKLKIKKIRTLEDIDEVEIKDEEEKIEIKTEETKKKKNKKNLTIINNQNFEDTPNESSLLNEKIEIKRKKNKEKFILDNPTFDDSETQQNGFVNKNYEVKRKRKLKNSGIENPNFNTEDSKINFYNSEFEVKRKKKKFEDLAIDNPNFDTNDSQTDYVDKKFEIERKIKKINTSVDNPNFENFNTTPSEPNFDLILNITSTPQVIKPKKSSIKRRKSVTFSDFNEERIIPNQQEIENCNELFDINSPVLANNLKDSHLNNSLEEISKKIEGFQAEVENDINEEKSKFIGEVGSSSNSHEKLQNGVKLSYRYANFQNSPGYNNRVKTGPKAAYKHLIKGDIVLEFKNTNLHKILGYGVKKPK